MDEGGETQAVALYSCEELRRSELQSTWRELSHKLACVSRMGSAATLTSAALLSWRYLWHSLTGVAFCILLLEMAVGSS